MKLKEICEKGTSNIAQKDIIDRNGIYPIYGASGFIKNIDSFAMDTPYIGIVKDGAGVGRVMLLPAKSSVIGTMQYIIPKNGINASYLVYLLESMNLSKYSTGATIPHIYFKDYGNKQVKERTETEQQRIANELDKVSELIDKRQTQLQKLDLLIKSKFVEMFGNISGKKVALQSICDIGSSKRIYEKEYVESGIPFYRTKEIVELAYGNNITTELFITRDRYNEIKNKYGVPQKNDLLVSAVGTIGVIWLVDCDKEFYYKDGNLLIIKSSDKFNSKFMKILLERAIANYKTKMSTGTAYMALTIIGLKNMEIYLPPIELQNQFADFVDKVEQSKIKIKASLDKLNTLKKALMQKYFG